MNVNAAKKIPPEQLGRTLYGMLTGWEETQEKEFVKAIDEAADACNEEIKNCLRKGHGVRTGTYRSNFRLDSEWITKHHYKREWYVANGHHRLTHLLENGHPIMDGTGRVHAISPPIKHIKYGRQIAEQVLEERLAGLWGG